MSSDRVTPFYEKRLDAYTALRAGAKRAVKERAQLSATEKFSKPEEHRAPVRARPTPPPSLTAREYLERFSSE